MPNVITSVLCKHQWVKFVFLYCRLSFAPVLQNHLQNHIPEYKTIFLESIIGIYNHIFWNPYYRTNFKTKTKDYKTKTISKMESFVGCPIGFVPGP